MKPTDITREVIWENTQPTCMARVEGSTGGNITPSDVSALKYNVFNLSSTAPTVALTTGTLSTTANVFETLQTDSRWSKDTTGYNFRAVLPSTLFSGDDQRYRAEFWFTPSSTGYDPYPAVYELSTKAVYGR
jgi:hypothetical protein